jgi:hypothetical protein
MLSVGAVSVQSAPRSIPEKSSTVWLVWYSLTRLGIFNSFQAISVIGDARIYFSLAKQRVKFLQKVLAYRNICTKFGSGKRGGMFWVVLQALFSVYNGGGQTMENNNILDFS